MVATEVPLVTPPVTPAAAAPNDAKAVEAEVQRQLAAKRKELEKAAASAKKATEGAAGGSAAAAATAPEPTEPPPTEAPPTPVPTARPEPTAIPTDPPTPEPRIPPPAPARETQRGDLVGPGAGVVEPVLVSAPRVDLSADGQGTTDRGQESSSSSRSTRTAGHRGAAAAGPRAVRTRSTRRSSPPCGTRNSSRPRRTEYLSKCGDPVVVEVSRKTEPEIR